MSSSALDNVGNDNVATSSVATTTTTTTTTPTPKKAANGAVSIADQRAKAACTFRESLLPGVDIVVDLRRILFSHTSPYQQIDIIETTYGKTLVTDGKTQSAAFDEYVYHESLVHPAMLSMLMASPTSSFSSSSAANDDDDDAAAAADHHHHPNQRLKTVFIGGGGELATAREVLRYHASCLEKVVMVDLDVMVIDACKQHLPEWGGASVYDHPKFHLVIGDAYQYLMDHHETFDVIIMDISDPIESGPGNLLYTQEFYQHVSDHVLIQPHGVFVTQAGMAESVPSAPFMTTIDDPSCHAPIYNTLRTVFTNVQLYTTNIPSFGSDWGYVMASNHPNHGNVRHRSPPLQLQNRRLREGDINDASQLPTTSSTTTTTMNGCHDDTRITTPLNGGSTNCTRSATRSSTSTTSRNCTPTPTPHTNGSASSSITTTIIDELIERYIDGGSTVLRHYDGRAHQTMIGLTKPLRVHLSNDDRIITKDRPIYMY